MKKIFEEPKLFVEQFTVADDVLTTSGWGNWTLGDDEMDVYDAISGDAIVKRN